MCVCVCVRVIKRKLTLATSPARVPSLMARDEAAATVLEATSENSCVDVKTSCVRVLSVSVCECECVSATCVGRGRGFYRKHPRF